MKSILLLIGFFVATSLFAQKKIDAYSSHYYLEDGSVDYIDSVKFNYSDWKGSILYNSPKFSLNEDGGLIIWNWEVPDVDYTTADYFSSGSLNKSHGKIYNANNLVISDTNTYGERKLFTYTASNKIASIHHEYNNMGTWTTQEIYDYIYDSNDRLVVKNRFQNWSGSNILVQIDSLFYNGSSQNILKTNSSFSMDGTTYVESEKLIYTYNANNTPATANYHIDLDGDDTTPLEWFITGTYNYTGANLTNFIGYFVNNNTPTTTEFIRLDYTYNSSNKPITERQTSAFGMEGADYYYDAEGFVTRVSNLTETSGGGVLYTNYEHYFYYLNTASINETVSIEFLAYPNPTNSILNIESPEIIKSINVYSLDGKLLLKQNNSNNVDLSFLSQGKYLVEVNTSKGNATKLISKL